MSDREALAIALERARAAETRLEKANKLAEALRRIEHFTFDVNFDAVTDLQAAKWIAREARADWERE